MSSADFVPSGTPKGPGRGVRRVVVLGGYGNFGARIVERLCGIPRLEVIVAGRCRDRARRLADSLGLESCVLDVAGTTAGQLRKLDVDVIVNTVGPFNPPDYAVAEAAIEAEAHYLDIADNSAHVCGINRLDPAARRANVLVTSGVSSVPALSGAIVDMYRGEFRHLRRIHYGITASELTPGQAAIESTLAYCGSLIRAEFSNGSSTSSPGSATGSLSGAPKGSSSTLDPVFGWQGSRWKRFEAPLGWRWLVCCDAPDLALFPERYPEVEEVRFRAGVALLPSMLGMWCLGWLVRLGLVRQPVSLAPLLARIARKLELFGHGRSGMYMVLEGEGRSGRAHTREWQLIAERNDGPLVPCLGIVALVRKMATEGVPRTGALPCMDLINLREYLAEFDGLAVRVISKTRAEHSGVALPRGV